MGTKFIILAAAAVEVGLGTASMHSGNYGTAYLCACLLLVCLALFRDTK